MSPNTELDPAPPSMVQNIAKLESILVDESMRMFERMSSFHFRNINPEQRCAKQRIQIRKRIIAA